MISLVFKVCKEDDDDHPPKWRQLKALSSVLYHPDLYQWPVTGRIAGINMFWFNQNMMIPNWFNVFCLLFVQNRRKKNSSWYIIRLSAIWTYCRNWGFRHYKKQTWNHCSLYMSSKLTFRTIKSTIGHCEAFFSNRFCVLDQFSMYFAIKKMAGITQFQLNYPIIQKRSLILLLQNIPK